MARCDSIEALKMFRGFCKPIWLFITAGQTVQVIDFRVEADKKNRHLRVAFQCFFQYDSGNHFLVYQVLEKKTSQNWVHSIINVSSWSGWICRFWRSSTGIIWVSLCSLSDDFCLFSVLGNLVLVENLNFVIWSWYIIILLILVFEVLHFSSQVMHGSNAPLLGRIITEEVNTDPLDPWL